MLGNTRIQGQPIQQELSSDPAETCVSTRGLQYLKIQSVQRLTQKKSLIRIAHCDSVDEARTFLFDCG